MAKASENNMKKEWGITITYAFLFLGAGMAVYLGLWFMPSKISEQGVNLWNELALPNEAKEVFTTSFEVFKKPWNMVGWINVAVIILGFVLYYFDKIKIDKLSKLQKKLYINIIQLLVLVSLLSIYPGFRLGPEMVEVGNRVFSKTLSKNFPIQIKIVSQYTSCFKNQWLYILPSEIILLSTTIVILLRFHGLPERHIQKADPTGQTCLKSPDCCKNASGELLQRCYRAQAYQMTQSLVHALNLPQDQYTLCYQSRLGREAWLTPYTHESTIKLARLGVRHLAVVAPSFISDCLETLHEIRIELKETFLASGGKEFIYLPCLNESTRWMSQIISELNP
jgi:protoheme ferro-lyase